MATKSFEPGSEATYLPGQIRQTGSTQVRFQSPPKHEATFGASEKLAAYLSMLPATKPSLAGTSAMYVECQWRHVLVNPKEPVDVEGKPIKASKPFKGLKIQVKGPAFNRPWGVEFVLVGKVPMDGGDDGNVDDGEGGDGGDE